MSDPVLVDLDVAVAEFMTYLKGFLAECEGTIRTVIKDAMETDFDNIGGAEFSVVRNNITGRRMRVSLSVQALTDEEADELVQGEGPEGFEVIERRVLN